MAIDFEKLKADIEAAQEVGLKAVAGMKDEGYISSDDVLISSLGRFSPKKFEEKGIHGWKPYPGAFRLSMGFGGQGDIHTVGVMAATEYLKSKGWDAYAAPGYCS